MRPERVVRSPATGASVTHVVVTRFNLPSAGVESLIRAQEGWLRSRVELFERYCLPSVLAQTVTDFQWLVYFDTESPSWLRDRIESWQASAVNLVPLFGTTVLYSDLIRDILAVADSSTDALITTNLDNDDALATDFIERVQAVPASAERTALFLAHGLVRAPQGLYLRRDRRNAFCSVRESWEAPMTCWRDAHTSLGRWMPTVAIGGEPGWLQVVHGSNVSNRIRGRLVSSERYEDRFGTGIAGLAQPTRSAELRDQLIDRPIRATRELARRAGKNLVLGLVGRAGLDRLKYKLAGGG